MKNARDKMQVKIGSLHPKNPHQGRYDFTRLTQSCPQLKDYLKPNPKGDKTIDFGNTNAVICLNKALLSSYYNIKNWQIPSGYLCPPIPGRADYVHYAADLVDGAKNLKILDIGTGASCIFPIIGSHSYDWQFIATDIDPVAVKSAQQIVQSNSCLKKKIVVIQQKNKKQIFKGIIKNEDRFDLTLCNPPFHSSLAKAEAANQRKLKNLHKEKTAAKLNFGGIESEIWCPGGEFAFIRRMIEESKSFSNQVKWFTSLVSKGDNVEPLKKLLIKKGAVQVKVIDMTQGQKHSRLIAWSFDKNMLG